MGLVLFPLPQLVPGSEIDSATVQTVREDVRDSSLAGIAGVREVFLLRDEAEERALILDYYRGERGAKIKARKNLAESLKITANALRIRIHRMRELLGVCVVKCAEDKGLA